MVSSYIDASDQNVITVIINSSNTDRSITIEMLGGAVTSWQPYLTGPNEGEELKPLSKTNEDNILIPGKSIITLVGKVN
jgi:hypothetical protein